MGEVEEMNVKMVVRGWKGSRRSTPEALNESHGDGRGEREISGRDGLGDGHDGTIKWRRRGGEGREGTLFGWGAKKGGRNRDLQRERTNFREPGARMDAISTVDLLVQPFLGLVLGIVTLGAMCTQQGSDIGKSSFWMVIAPPARQIARRFPAARAAGPSANHAGRRPLYSVVVIGQEGTSHFLWPMGCQTLVASSAAGRPSACVPPFWRPSEQDAGLVSLRKLAPFSRVICLHEQNAEK